MFRTAAMLASLVVSTAAFGQIHLSVANNIGNEIGGVTFNDGDVVNTNAAGTVASIFAPESGFGSSPDIDAFHVMPDGSWLVSALFNDLNFGGATSFLDGDIVRHVPGSTTGEVFFSETLLGGTSPDISAVSIATTGELLLSTLSDSSIGALNFTDGDLVAYDMDSGTASIAVAEAAIFDDGDGDIYALHALADGTYVMSAASDETVSGTLFRDGDLFHYDPVNDTASLYFSEDAFGGSIDDDIDALYIVPEPASLMLLALGTLALRRRR